MCLIRWCTDVMLFVLRYEKHMKCDFLSITYCWYKALSFFWAPNFLLLWSKMLFQFIIYLYFFISYFVSIQQCLWTVNQLYKLICWFQMWQNVMHSLYVAYCKFKKENLMKFNFLLFGGNTQQYSLIFLYCGTRLCGLQCMWLILLCW